MKNYKSIFLLGISLLITSAVQAGIISSATYTEQTGVVNVDFDTLTLQGHALDDWMIFDAQSSALVHTQLEGKDLLASPLLAGSATPLSGDYIFSWSDGTPIATGSNESELGFIANGSIYLNVSAQSQYKGIFRLYVSSSEEDTLNISTVFGQDALQVTVGANTHGYIDVTYDNNSAFVDTVRIQTTGTAAKEISFYATAVAQIPEPAVASLIILFGGSLLFIRRRFM
jgi:hypothetical protein